MQKKIYRQATSFLIVEILLTILFVSILVYLSVALGSFWDKNKIQIISALLFLLAFLISRSLWKYFSLTITLTEEGLKIKEGILNTKIKEINYFKINLVTVSQTLLGKIFDFGDLQINTGGDEVEVVFKNVQKPEEIRKEINDNKKEV